MDAVAIESIIDAVTAESIIATADNSPPLTL